MHLQIPVWLLCNNYSRPSSNPELLLGHWRERVLDCIALSHNLAQLPFDTMPRPVGSLEKLPGHWSERVPGCIVLARALAQLPFDTRLQPDNSPEEPLYHWHI